MSRIRKAVVAGLGAGAAAYAQAMSTGKLGTGEWTTVVGSAVVIGFLTWLTPNRADTAATRSSDRSR